MKLILFVEENKDKLDWDNLTQNPNAIELLQQTVDKIDQYFYQEILP
jgi:hypothetical protein